ncbi:MAG: hypothetical protein ACYCVY_05250 [Acidiferrobacteraceae bacterium]
MKKADPQFQTKHHPTVEMIDRWCCGLLNEVDAHRLERHLRGCARCQRVSQFGSRLATRLRAMPTTSRAERLRGQPARARRFAVAAIAGIAVLLAVVVALPLWTRQARLFATHSAGSQVAGVERPLRVVRHPEFYEWLARHPRLMKEASHADSA